MPKITPTNVKVPAPPMPPATAAPGTPAAAAPGEPTAKPGTIKQQAQAMPGNPPTSTGGVAGGVGTGVAVARRSPEPSIPIAIQGSMLVGAYDRDGSGSVDVARESSRFIGSRTDGSVVSIERIARVADLTGDRDGAASAEEFEAVMHLYDTGPNSTYDALGGVHAGDGMLTGSEWYAFMEDFGPQAGPTFADTIRDLMGPTAPGS